MSGVKYDIVQELKYIHTRMYGTNFEQDRIILSDAVDLIRDSEKYRTGMNVIYEGEDESDDILCPNCKASVARMDDYEEMRPAHCPECGTKSYRKDRYGISAGTGFRHRKSGITFFFR